MDLIIKSKQVPEEFFKAYLLYYIKKLYLNLVDFSKFSEIDKEFKINSHKILLLALDSLLVSKVNDSLYIISVNKNIKVNGTGLEIYLNQISYGNLSCKGYPILPEVFKKVKDSIMEIYWRWELGN